MEKPKPEVTFTGENGNVFNLLAIARKALEREGLNNEAKEMFERVFKSKSYNDALAIMGEYVEVT